MSNDRFHRLGGGVREFSGEDGRVAGWERGIRCRPDRGGNEWWPFVAALLARKCSEKLGFTSFTGGKILPSADTKGLMS